ncbi:MAG: GHKL domain-containing protein [Ruminococcus sp.]|nr:GHKL domain-containing protein [Ruminococcus sp.]
MDLFNDEFFLCGMLETAFFELVVIFFAYLNIGRPKVKAIILYTIIVYLVFMDIFFTQERTISVAINYISIILYCTFGTNSEKKTSFRFIMGILNLLCIIVVDFAQYFILSLNGMFDHDVYEFHQLSKEIIILPIFSISMVILSSIIFILQKRHQKNITSVSKLLLLNPVGQLALIWLLSAIIGEYNIVLQDNYFIIIYLVIVVLCIASNVLIIKISNDIIESGFDKQKKSFLEYYTKTTMDYHGKIESNLTEIRKIKHDFNNSIQVIKSLMDNNNISDASKIVLQLEEQYNANNSLKYCDNAILNVILQQLYDTCLKDSISLDVECSIPKDIPISEIDICNISNNMLQNSIEAVNNIRSSQIPKKISFSAWKDNDMIFLKTVNSKEHNVKLHNQKIITSKKDSQNHGFGLDIIRHIALSYNGNVVIDYDNTSFTILVQLNIQ